MGILLNNEERKKARREGRIGFPYPLKGAHRQKHNLIGEIPINGLTGHDYASMLKSAPAELKEAIEKERLICSSTLGDSKTYYEIRDSFYLTKAAPDPGSIKSPGFLYAFLFGDFPADFEFRKCMNHDEAKTAAIMLAVKRGDSIKRVYRLLSRGGWKRVRGVA
ncbi:hypothetical protein FTO70_03800 [Methanosarcina sp. KYL-1]|uniref:hypothetical protein n=1 Tax=Methanosarcina sp. KYL-1 TaxID=2602068 RepID=UPI00210132B5|nr:hypothetical protein [Methanosarcina sp. KYL-1]MCQ1534827.1 hypothetical protein [Methanosarcina sp. KYL-1]